LALAASASIFTYGFKASAGTVAYGAGTVSISALNIREQAGTTAPVIGTMSQGDTVVILDGAGSEWYHINYGGTVGYVAAMYIAEVDTVKDFNASGVLTGSDIRMRSTPDTASATLGVYPSGTTMQVTGINNGWYKVSCDGKNGYIRSDLMDLAAVQVQLSTVMSLSLTQPADAPLGQQIADYAYQFIGYPYVYGAASPASGFDCSGIIYYTYRQFGMSLSRTASQQWRNNGYQVSKDELRPGDLVFFSSNGGRSITHVGLYYGNGMFVNASTSRTGVIFSSLNSTYYTRVYYGAKRIVE
jgi:uncharacterized protein YraI